MKRRVFYRARAAAEGEGVVSHAGVYHVVSRVVDGRKIFGDGEKEVFRGMVESFAAFHQIEVLTFCLMGNHFHLLVRVPERPAGFDMELEPMLELLGRAVGARRMKLLRSQFRVWEECGGKEGIEAWRRRMLLRMFNLSEFMKALKQRFSQWYNRSRGRRGVLWEARYRSVVVQEEVAALRTMATYIDLNPVRSRLVEDPGSYRWSGYGEAMAGKAAAMEAIARVTGYTCEAVHGCGLGEKPKPESPGERRRRHLRALVAYRQMLGVTGRERRRADGTLVRQGLSERVRARLEKQGSPGRRATAAVRHEQLLRRVRHFTDGVVLGSREFINSWFAAHRSWFGGASAKDRKDGARPMGSDWKGSGLFTLRKLGEAKGPTVAGDSVA